MTEIGLQEISTIFRNAKTPDELLELGKKYNPTITPWKNGSDMMVGAYHAIRATYAYYMKYLTGELGAETNVGSANY
jgi:hypothetical protein